VHRIATAGRCRASRGPYNRGVSRPGTIAVMPFESHLNDALLFALVALALVLIALAVRSPARQAMLAMLIVTAAGVLGLWSYERFGALIRSATGSLLAREAGLAVVTFGVLQIFILFLFQTLLAHRRIPRILNDFVFALSLIGYAIYRLNAVGVNLASLITTSALVTGALAFSAQETLGNLWGGIALQLEKTCRIGDWVRIDSITGQVVGIRWRYMAIATILNETIVIPNSMVMKNRITVVARRGDEPYRRVDTPATPEQKAALGALSESDITATELAGDPITGILTKAPGNGAPIGGLKVTTATGWFAARPSGTEDVYKVYAESFKGPEHLARIQEEARDVVAAALNG